MLIDDVIITIQAGNGGNGSVHFRREKYVPKGGPDGGNGGSGASVYVIGDRDITLLRQFRHKKIIKAPDGIDGSGQKRHGANAADVVVKLPHGTLVTDIDTGESFEVSLDTKHLVARGGTGGLGNDEFKSATNQTPRHAESGAKGEVKQVHLDLQLIADVGLIGLPNAGKSSLLNELTNTQVKTANYPFTTLEANLGDMHGVIIADIPGLIENAHKGKGLGHKFLKHVAKTRLLIYCVSAESDDVIKDYQIVHSELEKYDAKLVSKPCFILLTKSDMNNTAVIKKKLQRLSKITTQVYPVSIYDPDQIADLRSKLQKK